MWTQCLNISEKKHPLPEPPAHAVLGIVTIRVVVVIISVRARPYPSLSNTAVLQTRLSIFFLSSLQAQIHPTLYVPISSFTHVLFKFHIIIGSSSVLVLTYLPALNPSLPHQPPDQGLSFCYCLSFSVVLRHTPTQPRFNTNRGFNLGSDPDFISRLCVHSIT
jgi:hypothetical protein